MSDQFDRYSIRKRAEARKRKRKRVRIISGIILLFVCLATTSIVLLSGTGGDKDSRQAFPSDIFSEAEERWTNFSSEMDETGATFSGEADEAGAAFSGETDEAETTDSSLAEPAVSENGNGTAQNADWKLILVNKWNTLPEKYDFELTELSNGQSVDSRIYEALQAMFDAARADEIYPVVAAGYRTAEKQQSLMDEKIAELTAEGYSEEDAAAEAEKWVAIPGTSEHQLGLAVDINADGIHSTGYEVYDWLAQNAHFYGFICRYPDNKTDITGVYNEPWHYRYVGAEAATEIYNSGLCLEEYLAQR